MKLASSLKSKIMFEKEVWVSSICNLACSSQTRLSAFKHTVHSDFAALLTTEEVKIIIYEETEVFSKFH